MIKCWIGFHRWRWFSLYDPNVRLPGVRVSQCDRCRALRGGWLGREFKDADHD